MIESEVIKQIYQGDGQTTQFPFAFPVDEAEHVKVAIYDIETETETTLTSDYYVDAAASKVLYPGYPPGEEPPESERPGPLPVGQKLVIYRDTPINQLEDLGEKYPLQIIEDMIDKATMILQEFGDKLGRALIVEMASDITPQEFYSNFRAGVATAIEKASEASASATSAGNSATAAGNSAAAAALSETAAGNSATAANNSKIAAAASETAAGNSATAAGNSATAAYNSQVAAAASETAAGNSATAAGNSATAAATSETNAGNSATAAHNSQVAAKASEDAAAQSAAEAAGINYLVRKNSTHYAEGVVAFYQTIPSPLVLECTTEGTTASTAPDFSGAVEGDTITDGSVVWTYKSILSGDGGGGGVPVGFILPYAAEGLEEGFLECDGSAVSRTMYPDLFAKLGTKWGAGDGSTTFNLPRSEDLVLQGASATNPVGTYLQAGLPNIEGNIETVSGDNAIMAGGGISGAFYQGTSVHARGLASGAQTTYNLGFDASQSNPIYGASNTVQSPAACVRFMIKAFDGPTPSSAGIDLTQYAQDLANKADRSLSNLTQTGEARFAHVVIDSYYDSATGDWYRVYADGWVEQGGRTPNKTGVATVTLLKPYSDALYTVVATKKRDSQSGGGATSIPSVDRDKTSTSFPISQQNESGSYSMWAAFGMGANS